MPWQCSLKKLCFFAPIMPKIMLAQSPPRPNREPGTGCSYLYITVFWAGKRSTVRPVKRIVMTSCTVAPLKINKLFNVRFEKQPISRQVTTSNQCLRELMSSHFSSKRNTNRKAPVRHFRNEKNCGECHLAVACRIVASKNVAFRLLLCEYIPVTVP